MCVCVNDTCKYQSIGNAPYQRAQRRMRVSRTTALERLVLLSAVDTVNLYRVCATFDGTYSVCNVWCVGAKWVLKPSTSA